MTRAYRTAPGGAIGVARRDARRIPVVDDPAEAARADAAAVRCAARYGLPADTFMVQRRDVERADVRDDEFQPQRLDSDPGPSARAAHAAMVERNRNAWRIPRKEP